MLGAGLRRVRPSLPRNSPGRGERLERMGDRSGSGAGRTAGVFVARARDRRRRAPVWRAVADYPDQITASAVTGDHLFLISTRSAPNGTVLEVDLARSADLEDAEVVMAPGDAILTSLAATDDGHLRRRPDRRPEPPLLCRRVADRRSIAAADAGNARRPRAAGGQCRRDLRHGGLLRRRAGSLPEPRVSPLGLDPASYAGIARRPSFARSGRTEACSRCRLLPPGARRDGSLPMLLLGYGSYGASNTEPGYGYFTFGLLEEGGAIGLCGTRGGGERGRSWHEAGRARTSQMRMPT